MGGPSAANRTLLIMLFQRTSVVFGATALAFSATALAFSATALAFSAAIASKLWAPAPLGTALFALTPTPPVPAVPRSPPGPGPEQEQALVARLLARPLFNLGRHPAAVEPPAAAAGVALPRLTGVLISAQARNAIFSAAGDGKPVVVGVGGSVSAFRVQAIEAGQVTLVEAGGNTRLLRPSFDPRPPSTQADASAARSPVSDTVVHRRPRPAVVTPSAPLATRTTLTWVAAPR